MKIWQSFTEIHENEDSQCQNRVLKWIKSRVLFLTRNVPLCLLYFFLSTQ